MTRLVRAPVLMAFALALGIGCGGGDVPSTDLPGSDSGGDVPGLDQGGFIDGHEGEGLRPDMGPGDDTSGDEGRDASGPACEPDEPCDDGDPCTIDDFCGDDGFCVGTTVPGCQELLECADVTCRSLDDCDYEVLPGWCLIDGKCYEDGETDPENPCSACVTALFDDRFVDDDSLPCDDGDGCTTGDRCRAGVCVGTAMSCDDGNSCTAGTCTDGSCSHQPLSDIPCNDGSLCTQDDVCQAGECVGTAVTCESDNPCKTASCDPLMGCVMEDNQDPCDDGNSCTLDDRCNSGRCVGGSLLDCDDGNPCTDSSCVPGREEPCVHIPNVDPCDDGDPCTVGDVCYHGECTSGLEPLVCDDGNLCTDNVCEPGVGCVFPNNTLPCEDGNPCTVGDACFLGFCLPGTGDLDCNDGDPCTDDFCVEGEGCGHSYNTVPCDDNNVCTQADVCFEGTCKGTLIEDLCDDGLACTIDTCHPTNGCAHRIDMKPECRPQIIMEYPPRAATLDGDREILVRGYIHYGLDSHVRFPTGLVINGTPVLPMPGTWAFTFPMTATQGFNPIVVDVQDNFDLRDHLVQSFYFSDKWYPVDVANPQASMVDDGLMLFLGPEVWDDNDTSDVDDIATILTLFLQNMDYSNMITNPVWKQSQGFPCYSNDYLNVKNLRFGTPSVDLVPVHGGLDLKVILPNMYADIDGKVCHISGTGKVTATRVTVSATMLVTLDATTGLPKVTLANVTSKIDGLNVELDGVLGFLTNWLINLFEGTIASQLEAAIKDAILDIVPALEEALAGLALSQDFDIPPLLPGGEPTSLSLRTKFSSITFTPAGGTFGMGATIVTARGTTHSPLGSIGRAACLTGVADPKPVFPVGAPNPTVRPLELGLHDDLFNLIPYSMYWGGALAFPVGAETLGQDLSSYGITDLNMNVDFLLPPILSACNPDAKLMLQIGDLSIFMTMRLFGMPVQMQMYASLEAAAELTTVQTDTGRELSIAIETPSFLDLEIASLSGGLVGAEDTLMGLMRDVLLPQVLDSFTGQALGSFPLPEFDLSGMVPGLTGDMTIELDIAEILRFHAYNVVSGYVK